MRKAHIAQADFFRNMNMKNKLLIVFLLIGLVPVLCFALITYQQSTKAFEAELSKYTVEIAKQAGGRLDSFGQEMERISNIVRFDGDVQTILYQAPHPSDSEFIQSVRSVRNLFETISNFRSHLKGIYLIEDPGILVYSSTGDVANMDFAFDQDPWFKQIKQQQQFHLNPVHPQNYVKGDPVVTFSTRVLDNREFHTKGTLLFDFSPTILREMSDTIQLGKTGYVFMMTEDGESVIPTDHSLSWLKENNRLELFKGRTSGHFLLEVNGRKTLVGFHTSTQTGWKIVGVVPFAELATEMNAIRVGIIIMILAALIGIFLLSTALSKMFTEPLKLLVHHMKAVEMGNFDVSLALNRRDEIGKLNNSFNQMVEELHRMKNVVFMAEVREYQNQLLLKDSELKSLQAQIKPHFLYNTLNVIVCIAEVHGVDEIVHVSQALSKMFKYSISGSPVTTLEEEIEHLKAYLSIVQVRFPNRFEVQVQVDPELMDIQVLKLICQPVVENCVKHAFLGKEGPGQILVSVKAENGNLIFHFKDDGIGMGPDQLRKFQKQQQPKQDKHIGLANVQLRLQMVYGDRFAMNIKSEVNEGTCVEIVLAGVVDHISRIDR
ncbi:cache domain-containing sensor histidine kinase [Paenibacillus alba]|uniref:Sensor histidine kinase n=1 Tax=Paenibacillus alba TaxID=1197127 RepID=A0ABU6FXI4_9BACL|nr:sensor histidine kinase [Paenibacillus alba]MEC0226455.1 sensor histidine kinase [Paenibacillus alba]NQX66366.1 sensor histidine kinase [Paenibacillus alba]